MWLFTSPERLTMKATELEKPALEPFTYKAGYLLTAEDLGISGIIISWSHEAEGHGAVAMNKQGVSELIDWLSKTLCMKMVQGKYTSFREDRASHKGE